MRALHIAAAIALLLAVQMVHAGPKTRDFSDQEKVGCSLRTSPNPRSYEGFLMHSSVALAGAARPGFLGLRDARAHPAMQACGK